MIVEPKITAGQALDSVLILRRYIEEQEDFINDDIFKSLDKLQNFTTINKIRKCNKQTSLDKYFTQNDM